MGSQKKSFSHEQVLNQKRFRVVGGFALHWRNPAIREAAAHKARSFTFLEVVVVISLVLIIAGITFPLMGYYQMRRNVDLSIEKLTVALIEAQEYAMAKRNGYYYYGLKFFNNLGDGAEHGFKIVRYEPAGLTPPVNFASFNVTKGPDDTAEFQEDTAFLGGVVISAGSELQPGDDIVFTSLGTATSNGTEGSLLANTSDEITLQRSTYNQTLRINALRGYVE